MRINFYDRASGGAPLGHDDDIIRLLATAPEELPTDGEDGELLGHAGGAPAWVAAPGGGVGRQRVLRAVARQTATTGVQTFQLPTDFATYELTEISVSATSNVATILHLRNDWLAAQEDGDNPKIGVLDAEEAGSRNFLTWTPSTRTFGIGGQGTGAGQQTARINYVRLFDPAGARGPKGDRGEPGTGTPASWAEDGNSDIIPGSKLPPRTGAFTSADESKLDGIAAGAEVNVRSDWNATSGDAQILNKPSIPDPGVTIIDTIASYDTAQNRFENSSGNAVALTTGSIVIVTQAVYDAAVADSFTFPSGVIFLTSA